VGPVGEHAGLGFGFEGLKLVVYWADGRPIPGEGGILRALLDAAAPPAMAEAALDASSIEAFTSRLNAILE